MERFSIARLAGTDYPLFFSVGVLLDVGDRYGGLDALSEALRAYTPDGVRALCWLLARLAGAGALLYDERGLTHPPPPGEQALYTGLSAEEYAPAVEAASQAIQRGLRRETKSSQRPIDRGLQQLRRGQGEPDVARADLLLAATVRLHWSVQDTLRQPPGVLLDALAALRETRT